MDLSNLKSRTPRQKKKRVGRGGKRGTTSGHGTKGQKGRAGSYVRPGFRGGDNRIWQLFPKVRGASKKHGSKRPHRKHRFYSLHQPDALAINLSLLNQLADGTVVDSQVLFDNGIIPQRNSKFKILSEGALKRKLTLKGLPVSKSAAEKIAKAGGSVIGK